VAAQELASYRGRWIPSSVYKITGIIPIKIIYLCQFGSLLLKIKI